jgi:hypothetical protein
MRDGFDWTETTSTRVSPLGTLRREKTRLGEPGTPGRFHLKPLACHTCLLSSQPRLLDMNSWSRGTTQLD